MKKIVELRKTASAFPEQYEGRLDTGEYVYMRVRFGKAEIRVGDQEQWDSWTLTTVAETFDHDNQLKGEFGPGDMAHLLRKAELSCDLDVDSMKEPDVDFSLFKTAEDLIANLPSVIVKDEAGQEYRFVTNDKDILKGRLDPKISENNVLELTPELLENLKNANDN